MLLAGEEHCTGPPGLSALTERMVANSLTDMDRGSVANSGSRAGKVGGVRKNWSPVFRGRHFQDEVIVLCVRWYLRYSLSYRDLEEMMAERGLSVDHSTVARWVLRYAPILNERMRRHLRRPNRSWRVDETYVRVAGKWTYLYRAVDSEGNSHRFHAFPLS